MDFLCGFNRRPPQADVRTWMVARPGSFSIGLSVGPGGSTMTVIPRGESSCAHVRPNPITALVAAYWLLTGDPVEVRLPSSSTPSGMAGTRALAADTWLVRRHGPATPASREICLLPPEVLVQARLAVAQPGHRHLSAVVRQSPGEQPLDPVVLGTFLEGRT
jgi:hypothetical protein